MRARQWTIAVMAVVVVLGGIAPQPGLASGPGVPAASGTGCGNWRPYPH
jgi:hypothetical protein